MSFDQAIKHKKTKRKAYRKAKAIDTSCRNHGGCPYCQDNRLHNSKLKEEIANEEIEDYNIDFFGQTGVVEPR